MLRLTVSNITWPFVANDPWYFLQSFFTLFEQALFNPKKNLNVCRQVRFVHPMFLRWFRYFNFRRFQNRLDFLWSGDFHLVESVTKPSCFHPNLTFFNSVWYMVYFLLIRKRNRKNWRKSRWRHLDQIWLNLSKFVIDLPYEMYSSTFKC